MIMVNVWQLVITVKHGIRLMDFVYHVMKVMTWMEKNVFGLQITIKVQKISVVKHGIGKTEYV